VGGTGQLVADAADRPPAQVIRLRRDLLGRLIGKESGETQTRYDYDMLGRMIRVRRWANPADRWEKPVPLDEIRLVWNAADDLAEETQIIHALLSPAEGAEKNVLVPLPEARIRQLRHEHEALGNMCRVSLDYLHLSH
jgi:YD repeat-containing protein